MKTKTLVLLALTFLMLSLALTTFKVHAYAEEALMGDITGPEWPKDSGLYPPDAKVNTFDLSLIGKKFGTSDPVADFTGPTPGVPDGIVDTYDLSAIGKHFGESRQGDGVLYVYTHDFSTEANKNNAANYQVYPGVKYNFTIQGITEFANTKIYVWARYQVDGTIYNVEIYNTTLNSNPSETIYFNWTIPSNLPITTSIKFKYGSDGYQGPIKTWFYASKDVNPSPKLMLVVPEIPLGAISAIAALFTGFKLKGFIRRKK